VTRASRRREINFAGAITFIGLGGERRFTMRTALKVLAASVGLLAPVFGHHSFAAEFDEKKPITLTGTVTKVEWMNPHAHFFIVVKNGSGVPTSWDLELGSPNVLMREGWVRSSLKEGDEVTVQGSLAKDGSNLVNARSVTLASGKRVLAGSSGGDK
jgi:hypothetical protein